MFKTKTNFSKEEIERLIDKYAEKYFVSLDINQDGYLTIFIGNPRRVYRQPEPAKTEV